MKEKLFKQKQISLAITLTISPFVTNAQFDPVIDLTAITPQSGIILNGGQDNKIASSVSSVGDFNGDGFDDVVMNSLHETSTASNMYYSWTTYKGGAYVVFGGNDNPGSIDLASISINDGFNIKDNDFSLNYTYKLTSAGDINGDGFDDILLAQRSYIEQDYYDYPFHSGRLFLVFGSLTNFPTSVNSSQFIEDVNLKDISINSLGDVNGDGFDDVLLCSHGYVYQHTQTTSASIVFGGNTGAYTQVSITGFEERSNWCNTGSKGDINGDGVNDIILSERSYTIITGQSKDQTYVIYGKTDEPFTNIDVNSLNGSKGFIVPNPSSGHQMVVDLLGDVNADGISDFAFAIDNTVYVVYGNSSGFSSPLDITNLNGSNGFKFTSGIAAKSAGDINGDGIGDMLINGDNANYIVLGKSVQFDAIITPSDLIGNNGFRIDGDVGSSSLSSAGDYNADGINDILIGFPTSGANNSGTAYILYGKGDLIFKNSFE